MQIQRQYLYLQTELRPRYGEGEARAIARAVVEDAFGWRPGRADRVLSDEEVDRWQQIQERLLAGEPVQYVVNTAHFYGLQLYVDPAVLIPRPETEELVEWIIDSLRPLHTRTEKLKLLDIGTGSGCIPLALKKELPRLQVTGADVSEAALAVAARNAQQLGLEVAWQSMDVLDESQWPGPGSLDAVVSNPPYIPRSEAGLMPDHVRRYEPELALFVDHADALLFYHRIAALARRCLRPGGYLFFECNEFNAPAVKKLAGAAGLTNAELRTDLQGKDRMVRAQLT